MGAIIIVSIICFIIYKFYISEVKDNEKKELERKAEWEHFDKSIEERSYYNECYGNAFPAPELSGDYFEPVYGVAEKRSSGYSPEYLSLTKCKWRGTVRCTKCFRRGSNYTPKGIQYGESDQCHRTEYAHDSDYD